jgi:pimeloyl-ACP methyl ester carboxylesterase
MPTTPVVSAVPIELRTFANADQAPLPALRAGSKQVSVCAQRVRSACTYGSPWVFDALAVSDLVSSAQDLDVFVFKVAELFRLADLGGLVGAMNSAAMANYNAALSAGLAIPAIGVGWQLLRFDAKDDGRVVEVRGDLTKAKHVVILVPGMTNDLSTVDEIRQRADRIYDEMAKQNGGNTGDVAVILWLGYNTPDNTPSGYAEAMGSDPAKAGAQQLVSDVNTFRSHGMNAHVTVVAHSYGSVVAAQAMKQGLHVSDVISLGSPGMDASSRQQLGSPNVHLWATATGRPVTPLAEARESVRDVVLGVVLNPIVARPLAEIVTGGDYVSQAPVHGPDPTRPGFGATVFPSSGGGHGAYFDDGSEGLENIGRIAVGKRPTRTRK